MRFAGLPHYERQSGELGLNESPLREVRRMYYEPLSVHRLGFIGWQLFLIVSFAETGIRSAIGFIY